MLIFLLALQDPVTVTVSGRAEFDGVVRGGALNETSVWIPGGLPDGSDLDNTDTLISPRLRLRFDIEYSTELAAVIELGNQRLDFDSGVPVLQNQRLGDNDTFVLVRQAFIQVRRWPADILDFQVGAMEFSLGGENPLFLSSDSESPWGEIPDSTVPPFPPAGTSTVPQTRRDELQPGGFLMRFSHEGFRGSLWLFPAVIEGGRAKDDEAIYGLDLSVDFDNFTVGILGALFAGEGRVGTFGAWIRGPARPALHEHDLGVFVTPRSMSDGPTPVGPRDAEGQGPERSLQLLRGRGLVRNEGGASSGGRDLQKYRKSRVAVRGTLRD